MKTSRDARKIVGAPTVSQRNSDRYRLRVTRRPYSLQRAHQVEQGLVTSQFLQNDRQQIPRQAQRSRPHRDLAHRQKPHLCAPASQFLLVAHGATASAPEECRWVAHADCLIDLVGGASSNRQLRRPCQRLCRARRAEESPRFRGSLSERSASRCRRGSRYPHRAETKAALGSVYPAPAARPISGARKYSEPAILAPCVATHL